MYSIILCGGSGTRLWPLSRKNYPKQFLSLYSDKSLLQETFLRMRKIMPAKNIVLVSNEDNFFNVVNQIREIEPDFHKKQVVVEPRSLNTAPAIALAFKFLEEEYKSNSADPVIILPADHHIAKEKQYLETVRLAFEEVGNNIGTIGIVPTKPETGYGYIQKGKKIASHFKVLEFKEKPDKKTAQKYLDSGKYVWNSGMYIFNRKTLKTELKKYCPELHSLMLKKLKDFMKLFGESPSISIDYAISEKSKKVIAFEGDFGWSDIGSFDSLAEVLEKNKDLSKNHVSIDSKRVFIHTTSDKLVATVGVEDLVVIENNDSILIQKRGHGEDVKKIVDHLKKNDFKEVNHNVIVHRPWGKYETLIDGTRHKVRKITIYPGENLQLQKHEHRAEHWIVIKGSANVINGKEKMTLKKNEGTFISSGVTHKLSNAGKTNLEMIEVQTGEYLGEDDMIVIE
ncbi:MAG: mannose-1-phosphate guanylyltransferase/mannose-6-phosphate isomerase [Candidatus Moranbacteria bacterium]|nr:mannose-1-phosphate guanylyltransferase/mannose-6-phosphate isomerase [Candidatus Moranbacteria bacterium]